ncbi:fungal-specific transcription factor domain-containing protein [Roridomyces roridus]|uniref:Fungal-specific transcription factor domain-containing protein n=1 Tax=Roridomyces roridus TaxID=1738132 RepID=A0AAD7CFC0_9AGAR|nr:fungal-specific transcription factor domain-containing protein [Roridomyces roridus]
MSDLTPPSDGEPKSKRRRLQHSCDTCRRRKIRCDSANMPDGRCSSCISFNTECTHTEPQKKRGPKNKHVEELKQQVSVLEAQLRSSSATAPSTSVIRASPPQDSMPAPPPITDEELSHDELSERFRQFSLGGMRLRFFGAASGFQLVKNAIDIKEDYLGKPLVTQFRRPEFWNVRPWEEPAIYDVPRYSFPETDLINHLMDLYFSNVHPTLPLLHRPAFQRSVAEGLHLRNHLFGALLLALLAVASRYSDDPRVFVPGADSTLSCGWLFFEQIQVIKKSLFNEPSVYEVQSYCLMTLYTLGTSNPQASWIHLGLGIRFLEERGAHRRKRDGHKPTGEDELWKRAFWCLLSLDRTVCSFLGRPFAIHVEDYDVELPLEVDDEYWPGENADPAQDFKQPQGQPSRITYFVCHIRLCEILGSCLRRLYATQKARLLMNLVGSDWEQRAVADLDSAMNEFLGSLPDHLRWNPHRPGVFFDQSATLHAMYYSLQITIHRPYIHKQTTLAFPSLAICTNAARSCIHVVDIWLNRLQRLALPFMQTPVFISGTIILLQLFGCKRSGVPIDVGKELAHVTTAMRILKFCETRWQSAGRLWELLQELKAWEGPPPPRRNAPADGTAAPPNEALHPADMCPTMRRALEEPPVEESSIFAPTPTTSSEEASPPTEPTPPEIHRPTVNSFATVADELSAYPMPAAMVWNDPVTQTAATANNTQPGHVFIEQMLAATAGYDDVTGLTKSADQWSNSTGLANMMVDDDLMSMWLAAPNGFGNLADWDAYIETKSGTGFNWATGR